MADFIGESNILPGVMPEDDVVEMAGQKFPCVDEGFDKNEEVDVVVRPEDIMVVGQDVGMLAGTVESVIFKGVHYEMMILRRRLSMEGAFHGHAARGQRAWAFPSCRLISTLCTGRL